MERRKCENPTKRGMSYAIVRMEGRWRRGR